jgi:formylglycine-generating enzyme required for sulfatase activity
MSDGAGRVRILIATTEGPVDIDGLYEEPATLGQSVAVVDGVLVDISDAYAKFVARETGAVERLFGHATYRMDLSKSIDVGDSWQLGCLTAHALFASGRLAGKGSAAASVVWTSGTIEGVGLNAGRVEFVDDKLRHSLARLRSERAAGVDVIVVLPSMDEQSIGPSLRLSLCEAGVEIVAVATAADLFTRLGLTIPITDDTVRPPRKGMRRVGPVAAAVFALALGAGLYYDVVSELVPPKPLGRFKDCATCPEMIVLPKATYRVSTGQATVNDQMSADATRRVSLQHSVAIASRETTIAQYSEFVTDTGRAGKPDCWTPLNSGGTYGWTKSTGTFLNPGYEWTLDYPVTCVNGQDILAFADWMSKRSKRRYRLPTTVEWEIAARAGAHGAHNFKGNAGQACSHARFAHAGTVLGKLRNATDIDCAGSNHFGPLPTGSLAPNAWGFYDTGGNVWEMALDCAAASVPSELTCDQVKPKGVCTSSTVGGGFNSYIFQLRPGHRDVSQSPFCQRSVTNGFRLAVDVD